MVSYIKDRYTQAYTGVRTWRVPVVNKIAIKVVEKFVKNLFYGEKHSFIEWTYVVGAHWNCLYEGNSNVKQRHMLLKLRKPILK